MIMKIGDLIVLRSARARKKLLEFAEKILVPTVTHINDFLNALGPFTYTQYLLEATSIRKVFDTGQSFLKA